MWMMGREEIKMAEGPCLIGRIRTDVRLFSRTVKSLELKRATSSSGLQRRA